MNNTHEESVLLDVRKLNKTFEVTKGVLRKRRIGTVHAVNEVSFFIRRGEVLGLVGESGCGKTTTGRCILRALEPDSGQVLFTMNGSRPVDIATLEPEELKRMRRQIRLVFQDPFSSLNPRMNVLEIVAEPLVVSNAVRGLREAEQPVAQMLDSVGLDPNYMRRYPHAFSGGQRQRIALARALVTDPQFVVADEPVSALDVSIQAQILNLLRKLKTRFDLTYLFIAHNLAVIEHMSDRVAVMYMGRIVELADTQELYLRPRHPYTEALLAAVPPADPRNKKDRPLLEGEIGDLTNPPPGCYFHPRCPYRGEGCDARTPELINIAAGGASPHFVSCHYAKTLSLAGVTLQ